MSIEIQVGEPHIAIHQGDAVWLSDPNGQVGDGGQRGLIFRDTRLISVWQIYADGAPWELVNSSALSHFEMRAFLTNPQLPTQAGDIPPHTLSLRLGRWVEGGVHEDIDIANFSGRPVCFSFEVLVRSDFADLFEIKTGRIVRRGRITTEWDEPAQRLTTTYRNGDFARGISIVAKGDTPAVFGNGRLNFDVTLDRGGRWHVCLLTSLRDGEEVLAAPTQCAVESGDSQVAAMLDAWRRDTMKLHSGNEEFYRLYRQAVDDMAALRVPVNRNSHTHLMPAAGLPWFVALFGRDSLMVALQTAPVTLAFARGALDVLGHWQAKERDDARDAEPGKIMHELRRGELAYFKLIPHTPYYGTADATPLYPVVLYTAWRWSGDRALLERHLATAERCLEWIEHWGDRDGDGFQEYQTRSPQGYENMGWKDSGDGVLYPDGTLVKGPKALCELQGYAYDAMMRMAEIYDALNRASDATALRAKAKALYDRFNEVFWDEDWGGYAFALDGDKKKVLTSVSNVGHCLWSGIVRPDRAARVVQRLLAPDMFSGWGVRTLSADHPGYNPYSYHNGSVWPHDNGIIAMGMKRYGFAAEAARVARAVSGAAAYFAQHQLPELYAGLPREDAPFPPQYLGTNVPQAWGAGSAFHFLAAILGLEPDAPNGVLRINPTLPHWLPELTLRELCLGQEQFDLQFRRLGETTVVEVLRGDAAKIVHTAQAAA
jgi:glycogen debranching enzyme